MQNKIKGYIIILLLLLTSSILRADEGMWMLNYLNQMNIKDMKAKGFKLSAKDISNINSHAIKDAIVIFGGGCTGEIVSTEGLLLTNHHCGYGAIQQKSTIENDLLKYGFWAMNREQEIPIEGLTVTFIREIIDVTNQIIPFLSDTLSEDQREQKVIQLSINLELVDGKDGLNASVKSFFGGNQYFKIVTEVFKDVRLVGAPPSSIGKFGGETDNWMWPRHTGDFSIFRVYSAPDGRPAEYNSDNIAYRSPSHLKISTKGYKEGDFSMIIGFPGSTQRYMSSYEIDYLLESENPNRIFVRGERQRILMEDMLENDTIRIQYATKYAGSANYWKNSIGKSRGLRRLDVMGQKQAIEQGFSQWVSDDPQREQKYGQALPMIEDYLSQNTQYESDLQLLSEALMRGTEIISAVVEGHDIADVDRNIEAVLVEAKRVQMGEFYKNYSPSTDRKVAKRMFAIVRDMVSKLAQPASFTFIDDSFGGDIGAYVDYVYDNSLFASQQKYEQFLDNPDYEVMVNDPAYKMCHSVTTVYNELAQRINKSSEPLRVGKRKYVAGLMEMKSGEKLYPDANFTMRLTYGQILPYEPADGVTYHYYTTLKGVIEKEDQQNEFEFFVPERLKELYWNKDFGEYGFRGDLPVNFISGNDITGGNSGSPVMNGKGELIGLAFDGNWEAMSGDIAFEPNLQRCISVDIRYVLFIIDKFAGAGYLLDEMTLVK